MRKLKSLLALVLLACSTASFAQFTSGGGRSSSSFSDVEAWKGIRFSYDRTFVNIDVNGADPDDYNGFTFGYEHAIKVAKNIPLFFQTGAGINFSRYSDSESDTQSYFGYKVSAENKWSTNVLGLTIPLNIVYGVKINDKLAIKPYTGFYLRVNLMSKSKDKMEISVPSDLAEQFQNHYGYDIHEELRDQGAEWDESWNNFDEDEVGKAGVWNRCQFGWQIGATLDISKFNVGLGYALDFNEIAEKTKLGIFSARVGFNF